MGAEGFVDVICPGDRFDRWHQATCRDFSRTECVRVPDGHFDARISLLGIAGLTMNRIESVTEPSDPIEVTRSKHDIRQDPRDYFMVWVAETPGTTFSQAGREVVLHTGDLVLHDQAQPFGIGFRGHAKARMLSIPRPLITARIGSAHNITARRVSGQGKLGSFAGEVLRQFARISAEDAAAERMAGSVLDILATAFETECGIEDAGGQRLALVQKYMIDRMADPDLDLEGVAHGCGLAPRTVNRLFARDGTTPIRWLWAQRLAAAHRALIEGRFSRVTDAALMSGFNDLSHFSKAFKATYGMSPRTLLAKRRNR